MTKLTAKQEVLQAIPNAVLDVATTRHHKRWSIRPTKDTVSVLGWSEESSGCAWLDARAEVRKLIRVGHLDAVAFNLEKEIQQIEKGPEDLPHKVKLFTKLFFNRNLYEKDQVRIVMALESYVTKIIVEKN